MGSSRRALQARIEELEARVARLVAEQGGAGAAVGEASPAEEVRDRRAFLRMAGVGAAAAAAVCWSVPGRLRGRSAGHRHEHHEHATSQTTVNGA